MIALIPHRTIPSAARFAVLALIGGVMASCQAQSTQTNPAGPLSIQETGMQSLSNADFQATLLAANEPQLLDVRTAKETAVELIPGAMVLDVMQPGFAEKAKAQLDPSRPVWVYCRSGSRSKRAAAVLEELGFGTIYELDGGIVAWKSGAYPTQGQHTAR